MDQLGTTPADHLATLEEAVCEFLRKVEAGTMNPFSKRLDRAGQNDHLRTLGFALGYRYAQVTLLNFEVYDPKQKEIVSRLRHFADTMPDALAGGGGLLLFGGAGTGKDHLLAALLKIAIARHGLSAVWYDGQVLFEEARHAIKRDKEHEFRTRLCEPHILALSDPQPPQGDLSDYQIGLVRDLIDRRYRRCLSTWLTTNLDRRDDADRLLTAPVMQRLKESSGLVFCDWPSYRERQKASW